MVHTTLWRWTCAAMATATSRRGWTPTGEWLGQLYSSRCLCHGAAFCFASGGGCGWSGQPRCKDEAAG